ncbi:MULTISPECIES: bactofilin family protein [Treponema]|uniref:Polymer-forming cytoskeletal protein n=6 Tax=Treponema TaxID=157 RepID=O83087_TREPA|nr:MULTISPECIES: polymer-forming cytoskeletal protein [Treponema]AAC65044.1 conserved hypothetical protein [Treponema pallidum subsp. pallidum str. Nichols]ACD70475.1 hypothetical protein TPASS_0048 [Treponema pallidum subsp. pallidum SS14]ADD72199.1 protein of unknown function [Treponema pallidum subsp. pallidum str. Chicago]AEH40002.1 conserved hypothetical protein [Treponema paraluiscuniculi Cuniculi A]AEZ57162.1 hypothetical protein TPESAMD_0048 [Treponema pallidum subsp. pertenue str. Sam
MAKIERRSMNTLIGAGSRISGNVVVPGSVRIEGDVDGDVITTGHVVIGKRARVRGVIRVGSIIVGGMVEGDIVASEAVQVLPSGVILGAVLTRKIVVDEQAFLDGFCYAVADQEGFNKVLKAYLGRKSIHTSAFGYNKYSKSG